MNHKPKMLAFSPLPIKGRSKEQRPKFKETVSSVIKKVKDRPPTRRNTSDTDKSSTTSSSRSKRSYYGNDKYKTSYMGLQTPRPQFVIEDLDHHEYLQFSLHITDEIIRKDMFRNDEMIQVLKKHYQANKSRLNQKLLIKTTADLCSELNIPINDSKMLFLDDQRTYFKVELKLKDPKQFSVLHNETANYVCDKNSDVSLPRNVSPVSNLSSISKDDISCNEPMLVMSFDKPQSRPEKNLAIAHYAFSVEPEFTSTKEFSTQATLNNNVDVINYIVVNNMIKPNIFINDATTQKSAIRPINCVTSCQTLDQVELNLASQKTDVEDDVFKDVKCQACNTDKYNRIFDMECGNSETFLIKNDRQESAACRKSEDVYKNLSGLGNVSKSFVPNSITSNMDSDDFAVGKPYNKHFYNIHLQRDKGLTPYQLAPTLSKSCSSLLPDKLTTERLDQYGTADRYRKVNEYLSFFYPTMATQVSSMDLLNNVYLPEPLSRSSERNKYEQRCMYKSQQLHQHHHRHHHQERDEQYGQQQFRYKQNTHDQHRHQSSHQSSRNSDKYKLNNYNFQPDNISSSSYKSMFSFLPNSRTSTRQSFVTSSRNKRQR